ncbi:MAG: hypothetical protein WCX20_01650 [Candidatus Shapirobacteria bacterium]
MLELKVESLGDCSINDVAREGLILASRLNLIITTSFNNITVKFYPQNDTVEEVVKRFKRDLGFIIKKLSREYKPYEKPSVDWIGKDLRWKIKNYSNYFVRAILTNTYGEWVLLLESSEEKVEITLKELFEEWEWADGSPCGDEV